ncbi:alpha/beta fold hydrolase [Sphingomonas yantingensis]|uniref:Palmitoyl-protein thioesterase ABHD10, mitochondrial n=1 Tax=Sphingomonas yantingensis TaxID=1241761 RepID=A0A7W9EIU3_9SPHN|nr:alpha/beta hydrolase [Sphingomonas yantingensis]MBB5699524.1 pimeloyl-ACP methyl ester carboxylesterase [Sphingomonas yantingensis]
MTDHARIAFRVTEGEGPTIVFLPGYASDMTGTKALALEAWAKANGRAFIRFDYRGCGESEGAFEDYTLADWRDDVLLVVDQVAKGPVVLVGSSMGGWIALLVAKARPERVTALVGIAPAPDFTDWGFSQADKMTLLTDGRLEKPSPYSDQPTVTTRAFWTAGEANRLMHGTISLKLPVRIVQGMRDPDVPWERAARLAQLIEGDDVQCWLVKDGDHRLSRDQDVAMIVRAVEEVS